MNNENELLEVNAVRCSSVHFDCPGCGAQQDGFLSNPAGGKFNCESCGIEYKVNAEADIEFW
jgi:rubredoxin